MNDRADITISVTREVEALIRSAMAERDYATPNDAIRDALLGQATESDEILGYTVEELRRLGDEGEASGPGTMTLDEIQREGLRRAERARLKA